MQIIVVYGNGEKMLHLSLKKFIAKIIDKVVDSISGLEVTTHKSEDLEELLEEIMNTNKVTAPQKKPLKLVVTEKRKANGSRQ